MSGVFIQFNAKSKRQFFENVTIFNELNELYRISSKFELYNTNLTKRKNLF